MNQIELTIKKYALYYYRVLDDTYPLNSGLYTFEELGSLPERYKSIFPIPKIRITLEHMIDSDKERVKNIFLQQGLALT